MFIRLHNLVLSRKGDCFGSLGLSLFLLATFIIVPGCSRNPATGALQLSGFMPESREAQIGAEEHKKIVAQYGLYPDPRLQDYVSEVGARVVRKTERPDVRYRFFVLDTPVVNAFALPGGYVYVSRGLLSLANSEAELAGVLAHEVGHITARHSAERYSHGILTSLGANAASLVIGGGALVSQAVGVGAKLYLSGYSRSQENEADTLAFRYMAAGGYTPDALPDFLQSMNREKLLRDPAGEKGASVLSYFSTHPPTEDRVKKTRAEAKEYAVSLPVHARERYLKAIDGMVYGEGVDQGFVKDGVFYHPGIGFAFDIPEEYTLKNGSKEIALVHKTHGDVALFDFGKLGDGVFANTAEVYIREHWLKGKGVADLRRIQVGGMDAGTGVIEVKKKSGLEDLRVVAVSWDRGGRYARFQMRMPEALGVTGEAAMKGMAYSFRRLSSVQRDQVKPPHIRVVQAIEGDTVSSLAKRQLYIDPLMSEQNFRVLNGLKTGQPVEAGDVYKLVVQ